MKHLFRSLFVTAALSAGLTSAYAQSSGYHLASTFHIASDGGWDYIAVSPVSNNIYVSHRAQVNILNKQTGDSTGIIEHTDGVHGIAFAPEFKKGFTSNGKLNTVTVFDINTNAVIAQIQTGDNPDAIIYDPFSKKVLVCNGHSDNLTVIDPADNKVVATVALGGKPETPVSDNEGHIYINIEDKSEIVMLTTKKFEVEKRWKTGKGTSPSGLAIDVKTKRLFAGCDNKLLVVMNAENGKVVKELPIGDGCDGVAFDAGLNMIYSSNGEGTLTIIKEESANSYTVIENLPTQKGARTLAVDPATHNIYLPTADFASSKPAAGQRPGIIPGSFRILVIAR